MRNADRRNGLLLYMSWFLVVLFLWFPTWIHLITVSSHIDLTADVSSAALLTDSSYTCSSAQIALEKGTPLLCLTILIMSSVDVPGPLLPGNAKESSDSTAVPRPLGLPTPIGDIPDNTKEITSKDLP